MSGYVILRAPNAAPVGPVYPTWRRAAAAIDNLRVYCPTAVIRKVN